MSQAARPLALVTGASSGIGFELAACCAARGFDLLIAADRPELSLAAEKFRESGVDVTEVQADLATREGVDRLIAAAAERPVQYLLANAGHGLGHAFLDQEPDAFQHVIDTNVSGTLYLIHRIGRQMRDRGEGRILITGSIAGVMPGSFQAVYNASKAFLDNFAYALANELKDSGVSVTVLMPGVTETEFFERAGLLDTQVGQDEKMDPADVAKTGFDAMMDGKADVVAGWKNKLQVMMANFTSNTSLAEKHRKMTEPGSAARS